MDLSKLLTETRNPETIEIDNVSTSEMLRMINNEDKKIAFAVEKEMDSISKAVDAIVAAFHQHGRLIYIGAGTSGRLGILDASECPPTYGTDPSMVQGLIAGGRKAILNAVEGAEDDSAQGALDVKNAHLTKDDILVGIAASGRTPYVIGAMEYAKTIGTTTVSVTCNGNSAMAALADIPISVEVGPEVITGSTRMKAGTAQKMVLNMLTTGAMIRSGKVYSNLMVDVKATNKKLIERKKVIVRDATGITIEEAENYLTQAKENPKLAIFMALSSLPYEEASRALKNNNGFIREALNSLQK